MGVQKIGIPQSGFFRTLRKARNKKGDRFSQAADTQRQENPQKKNHKRNDETMGTSFRSPAQHPIAIGHLYIEVEVEVRPLFWRGGRDSSHRLPSCEGIKPGRQKRDKRGGVCVAARACVHVCVAECQHWSGRRNLAPNSNTSGHVHNCPHMFVFAYASRNVYA